MTQTYADFSEELVRKPDGTTSCPYFMPGNSAQQATRSPNAPLCTLRPGSIQAEPHPYR